MIVRWSLGELPSVVDDLGASRPFLVASERWTLPLDAVGRWSEVPAPAVDVPPAADVLVAVGGGSAIDTAKHASAQTGLPVVSVPTTYSGAEWSQGFGVRSPDRKIVGGGRGAHLAGIVYDVELTLGLPRGETVGTALNALAHCAEALYVQGHTAEGDAHALEGARLIASSLPEVVARPQGHGARERLLRGACQGGQALGLVGLALAHAMAQAVGGRYGLPHGAMNALCLPPALRFNSAIVPDAVARLGDAMGASDPPARVEQLARLGGFERLRDFGVPEPDLPELADAAAARPGNRANPRPATREEIYALLKSIY